MKYKSLGKTGVKVSELCLGTSNFGRQVEEAASITMIRRAVELGVNFIDTANEYANGRAEEFIGKAIDGMRDELVLASKVGLPMSPRPNAEGLSRKHILKSIKDSLKRLQTDYIDLYQVHRPDPTSPLTETLSTLSDLVRAGTVHYIGCSNFTAWQIENALRISEVNDMESFISAQPQYNILVRDVERALLPLCLKEGIAVIPYSPLAGGYLTGKYRPNQPMPEGSRGQLYPRLMRQYLTERNQVLLHELKTISNEVAS